MEKNESYYAELLKNYLHDNVSAKEANELFDFIRKEPVIAQRILELSERKKDFDKVSPSNWHDETTSQRMLQRLVGEIAPEIPVRRIGVNKWWYAAAAIFIIAIGVPAILLLNKKQTAPTEVSQQPATNDVKPGGNKAILTLANGKKIILDSAGNGTIAEQGNTAINKTANGKLVYQANAEKSTEIIYNTLSTPNGGQYQLTLPDGTKVWLNAASSITYPTAFTGKERNVTITGEAYFEVVHNAKMPFHVQAGKEMIEDIGTSFNVNAYSDEATIKTTLIEGSIKINASKILKPGEQGIDKNNEIMVKNDIDVEQVMAWKNGLFNFDGADLQTVLKQLGRWYDVEVVFEGKVPVRQFGGEMSRDLNLSQVLISLEKMEVKFRIEGKKLIVLP